ncbi:MAG: hypothetical protein ACREET_13905, partial [Stellaceae bacterium]
MSLAALVLAAALSAAAAVVVAVILLVRFAAFARRAESPIEPALARLDSGLRDELVRGRGLAAEEARSLREEVMGAVTRLGDSLQRTIEGRLEPMRADNAE